jgi:hypothetical protein
MALPNEDRRHTHHLGNAHYNGPMKRLCTKLLCLTCGGLLALALTQSPHLWARPAGTDSATLLSLVERRDAFVERARDSGFSCEIAPAQIRLSGISSYGGFDAKTNVLHTPTWQQLKSQQRGLFYQLAGPGTNEVQVRRVFDSYAHRWILIHELAHWVQSCRHSNRGWSRFEIEYDADRIAAAYWREVDPALMDELAQAFRGTLKGMPVQLPVGETPERYFNEHFDEISKTPSFTWFQAFMIASVEAEDPLPSFREALKQSRTDAATMPSR